MKFNTIQNCTLSALLLLSAGCITAPLKTTPLTTSLIKQYNLGPTELAALQYYPSDDIELTMQDVASTSGIKGTGVSLESRRVIDYVVVPDMTPGIAVNTSDESLEIAFEEGSSFTFSNTAVLRDGTRKEQSLFSLVPDHVLPAEERGELGPYAYTYRGKEYHSRSGSSVYLLVVESKINEVTKTKHRMQGLKIEK